MLSILVNILNAIKLKFNTTLVLVPIFNQMIYLITERFNNPDSIIHCFITVRKLYFDC